MSCVSLTLCNKKDGGLFQHETERSHRLRALDLERKVLSLLDCRSFDLNLDLIGNQHAAGIQRSIEVDTKIATVDLGLGLEAQANVAEWIFCNALDVNIKDDGLGNTLDGEVAGDLSGVLILDYCIGSSKVSSGKASVEKKSSPRTCASRSALPVVIDADLIVAEA